MAMDLAKLMPVKGVWSPTVRKVTLRPRATTAEPSEAVKQALAA
jgi:hypothetical protein